MNEKHWKLSSILWNTLGTSCKYLKFEIGAYQILLEHTDVLTIYRQKEHFNVSISQYCSTTLPTNTEYLRQTKKKLFVSGLLLSFQAFFYSF